MDDEQQGLSVPDRFEQLRDVGAGPLRSVVYPVEASLGELSERFVDMDAAGRGGLVVLRGAAGAGKSTFLDTVGLFRRGVVTERIPGGVDIPNALEELRASDDPRVVVIEGREALMDVSDDALEASLHAINRFVRSDFGNRTLVVWPANADNLAAALVRLGNQLGGEALMGLDGGLMQFHGPPPEAYVAIAERTVSALNDGASLAALGISEEAAHSLVEKANTIGHYLALVRRALIRNGTRVRELMPAEQLRMWVVVIAGDDPDGDVAALTRGGFASADIDRLMTSTGANIVRELKREPDTLGILGTVLDARTLHVDILTALAVAREYGDETLHDLMKSEGMSLSGDGSAVDRITSSELGVVLSGETLGTRRRGSKPGSNTQAAFQSLANVARSNDAALNRSIGAALVAGGLAEGFEDEVELDGEYAFRSDLCLDLDDGPLRIEVMWRASTSRAEIANYVLGKLGNYARNIGLLGGS